MNELAGLFVVYVLYVALKSFQQRNVTLDADGWIFITSLLMGLTEVFMVGGIVTLYDAGSFGERIVLGLTIGVAGAAGCLGAMRFWRYLRRRGR